MSIQSAVELKGGMYTLLSLQIHSTDAEEISLALKNKVLQAPSFFKDTPIVLDLSPVELDEQLDTHQLLEILAENKLIAIAARVNDKDSPAAQHIQLPVLDGGPTAHNKTIDTESNDEPRDHDKEDPLTHTSQQNVACAIMPITTPTIITRPVRSGQQLYAQNGELVVLAQVGAGAELISDSNIHVYGPLRGRALCGVTGNTKARIFCSSLEAELVSVAGNYKPLEEIPAALKGKPAQIWLEGTKLRIEPL